MPRASLNSISSSKTRGPGNGASLFGRGKLSSERQIQIAVDAKTHRPGCVLIQAAYGLGDNHDVIIDYSDIWVLAPTKSMIVLKGTESQARQLFDLVLKKFKSKEKR